MTVGSPEPARPRRSGPPRRASAAWPAPWPRTWRRWTAPVLADLAAVDGRRIAVVVTIVADHLYLEVNGRTLDGPLHRAA